jgi:alpha-beta hydrolase superfamily lysophospholipase
LNEVVRFIFHHNAESGMALRLQSLAIVRQGALALVCAFCFVWNAAGGNSFVGGAQPPESDEPPPPPAKPAKAQAAAPKLQKLTLETKDGVQLYVEYVPGTPPRDGSAKDVVPVVLLHMAKGSGADWKPLVPALVRAGHAVIVPDLRGHGQSTEVKRGGQSGTIDQATMRKSDFDAMVRLDMERIKKFIISENNAGKLNLRKLCVVGAELGAAVAVNWAALDWSWPPLATGPQGQDVNGLVLITPIWSHKGTTIVPATKTPAVQGSISTMIIVGAKDSANMNDARRLYQILQKYHDEPPPNQAAQKKDLFFITPGTSLQGTKMLGEKSLGVEKAVLEFIQLRLVNKQVEWSNRDRPLD